MLDYGEEHLPSRVRIRSSNIQQKLCVLPVTDQTGDLAPRVVTETELPFLSAPPTFGAWESHSCASISGLLVTPQSAIMPLYRYLKHTGERFTSSQRLLYRFCARSLASGTPQQHAGHHVHDPVVLQPFGQRGQDVPPLEKRDHQHQRQYGYLRGNGFEPRR
jgi:hypothetical protein